MSRKIIPSLYFFAIVFTLLSCSSMPTPLTNHLAANAKSQGMGLTAFEQQIAQRMMISIRNFCLNDGAENGAGSQASHPTRAACNNAVVKLPKALADLITGTEIGGVVLFSENIGSHQQVIQLTQDLQAAAGRSKNSRPLFIGIDQEGGRVVRLNRKNSTSFSGNMAIAATYPTHGVFYANKVGNIIGKELNALGINLNFSPDVDINNHPDNPVINVRSFGEKPKVVSALGMAMMDALQAQNVIATLKHFPGHGNTNIDSHTGLPSVAYDRTAMDMIDLVPFKDAIVQSNPGMIMTAHIQYPNMDDTTIVNKKGETIVAPATMSYRILKQLLRDEMGYRGVVITDALNMGSISHHFEPAQAAARSLLAGADIALMPFRISRTEDIIAFKYFLRQVAKIIANDKSGQASTTASIRRIEALKKQYINDDQGDQNKLANAQIILGSQKHRASEKKLALDSITLLKNTKQILPWGEAQGNRLHLVVQDSQQLKLITQTLLSDWKKTNKKPLYLTHTLLSQYDQASTQKRLSKADLVMVFFSEKRESAVVRGELDNLLFQDQSKRKGFNAQLKERIKNIKQLLAFSTKQGTKTFVAGMQSPYEMQEFINLSDAILIAFDPSIYCDSKTDKLVGYTYEAIIAALLGVAQITGELPVSLKNY